MSRTIELVSSFGYKNLGHITVSDAQLRDNAGLLKAIQQAIPQATRVTPGKSLLNPQSKARPVIWVFLRSEEPAAPKPQAPQVTLSDVGARTASVPAVAKATVQANTRQDNRTVVKVASSVLKTNRTLSTQEKRLVTQLVNTGRYSEAQARAIVVGK